MRGQPDAREAPPANVVTCLDELGCSRLDHGYNVLADGDVVRRCRDEGVPFTVVSHSCVESRLRKRWQSIRAMRDAGLNLVITSDDPTMFRIDIGDSYVTVCGELGLTFEEAADLSLASIDATWLDDDDKRTLRRQFLAQIDSLKSIAARGPLPSPS